MSDSNRERILQKVKKLMALATDGRGNEQEAETALRQAQILMEKFNIDEAEVIQNDLTNRRAEVLIKRWKKAGMNVKPTGTKSRSLPTWAGVLAVGVAVFCDVRATVARIREDGKDYGDCVVFAGYNSDVDVACWTFDYLMDCMRRRSKAFNTAIDKFEAGDQAALDEFELSAAEAYSLLGVSSKGRGDTFRFHMATRLQRRMKEMKAKQSEEQTKTNSSALIVLNAKLVALDETFGPSATRPASHRVKGNAAAQAGYREGDKTRLNAPIASGPQQRPGLVAPSLRLK